MSESGSHSIPQGNFISADPRTNGFDQSSGAKWIYPENLPRRDYQFSIVQTALYNNTLVCLPTGLGKTFIAAVVMYNFWRWYPQGRIVFLAPTKPLVAQQINACHEIMDIPSEQTIELTGTVPPAKRAIAWTQKRVIFATPQTFEKDLQNGHVPCELIKCIVFDEAHKALKKHSYCEIVRMVNKKNKFFRVLALSATPGSSINQVKEVIQNLLIFHLELRDDESSDITPYTNYRSMEKIVVNLGKDLNVYKDRYVCIMDRHVRILIKNNIIQGNAANFSKGRIFMLTKEYESRPNKAPNHGPIMNTLNILITMYHAYELLLKHGLRAFYHFYSIHSDKYWLDAETDLNLMLEEIRIYIGDFPVIQPADDGTIPEIPDNLVFGHNKFKKLQDVLIDHFESFSLQNKSTRAIVFVEYRDIVNEVYVLLLQKRPLIRPQMFVGQAGQKQKLQLAALEDFRSNKVNVLISTSVGEEGLDVGEVDLIVCFDISTSTPTRLVQRMGRTGRKRSGRVVLLLTEKEVYTLNQAMSRKNSLNNKVLQSSNIASSLYQSSPRMVPQSITPECLPMVITPLPKTPKVKCRRVPAQKVAKPPAEKKRRKKEIAYQENDDCLILPSTSKSTFIHQTKSSTKLKSAKDVNKSNSDIQPSMDQPRPSPFTLDADSGFLEDFQLPEHRDNPYSFIRPHEVKLLTSDSHASEFLTLCAMKKSEESSTTDLSDSDLKWVPPRSPKTEDMFRDLKIPSTESLECIRNLKMSEKPSLNNDEDSFFPDGLQVPQICNNKSDVDDESSRQDEGIDVNFFDEDFDEIEFSSSDFLSPFTVGKFANSTMKQDDDSEKDPQRSATMKQMPNRRESIVGGRQPSQENFDEIEFSSSDFLSPFTVGKLANSTMKQDDDSAKDPQRSSKYSTIQCSAKQMQSKGELVVVGRHPLQYNLDEIEVSSSDFLSPFTTGKPANSTMKQDGVLKKYSQRSSNVTPANVEVEFENLIDLTESGDSDTSPEGGDIFDDDLLEDDSSTGEVLHAKQNVTPPVVVRAKRSASSSREADSPSKKQKPSNAVLASKTPSPLSEGENIFDDDLLEGDSSTDADLFANQNVAVAVPGLNKTVREKRNSSPKKDSPSKKQKLSHVVSDCSDNKSSRGEPLGQRVVGEDEMQCDEEEREWCQLCLTACSTMNT